VAEVPDARALANGRSFVDDGGGVGGEGHVLMWSCDHADMAK
jgi:hypothetical protein